MYNFNRTKQKPSVKGTHLGIVVANDETADPDKQEGIKVRIKYLHDGIPDKDLPITRAQRGGHANHGQSGSLGPIPPIGSAVYVQYDGDDFYNGKYISTPPSKTHQPEELRGQDQTGKDYPHVQSHIDPAGNRLTINHKRNTVDFEHVSGALITIDGKGHIGIRTASKGVGKDAREKHSPGLTIQAKGPISFVGSDITFGGDTIKFAAKQDMHLGAKGGVHLSGQQVYMPEPIKVAGPVGNVPTVNDPASRSTPTASAPSDPTTA
jgi:hypothetical protein